MTATKKLSGGHQVIKSNSCWKLLCSPITPLPSPLPPFAGGDPDCLSEGSADSNTHTHTHTHTHTCSHLSEACNWKIISETLLQIFWIQIKSRFSRERSARSGVYPLCDEVRQFRVRIPRENQHRALRARPVHCGRTWRHPNTACKVRHLSKRLELIAKQTSPKNNFSFNPKCCRFRNYFQTIIICWLLLL